MHKLKAMVTDMIGRSALILMVLLATFAPADAGSVATLDHYSATIIDQGMKVDINNKNFVSGTDVKLETTASLNSRVVGEDPPERTADYLAILEAADDPIFNPYYVWMRSDASQTIFKRGEDPADWKIYAKSYIIMPKTFDATMTTNMRFSDSGNPDAELITTFTYDEVTYTFSDVANNIEREARLEIPLYPYCPLLKDLDLDYENVFIDSIQESSFGYQGRFVMRAVQT